MLSMLVALVPATAWAWPADVDWVPLTDPAGILADPAGDLVGDGSFDLFGDAANPAASWYADDANLYLRLRLLGDPQSGALLKAQTWGWLVELDGDDVLELVIASEGATGQLSAYENTGGAPGVQPGFGNLTFVDVYGTLATGQVRRAIGSGSTFFLDIQLSRLALDTDLGIGPDDTIRLAAVSAPSVFSPDWTDVTRCDGACGTLLDALSDAIQLDADLDGWTGPQEAQRGTDPYDADTDDDGVLDGLEGVGDADGDGIADALDCDADGDGILDGTESGLTTPELHADTDLLSGCFVADADPTAPDTNPLAQDTDGGGAHDGAEDWDHDGEIDAWETDPNDPADDVDSDGDGIADVLELRGADGQVIDIDSDGDGIPDGAEGLADPDHDNVPNFLDDDSDGDGIPDATEGGGDTDGDGIPDFEDPDSDGDGRPDADEGDDDSDGDDVPDFQDPDSDDDGIPDDQEGDGDEDCDGIVDYLDPDPEDSFCDTATPPTVDTGDVPPGSEGPGLFGGGQFTGGACSTAPVGAAWFPMMLAGLLIRRRRRALAAAALLGSTTASAQEVNAQRFTPSVDGGPFVKLEDALPNGPAGTGGLGIWLDYADDPLVYRPEDGDEIGVLESVATTNLTGFVSLGRFVRIGADVPLHLYTAGFEIDRPVQLGDARISGKGSFVTVDLADGLDLGAVVDLTLPTGASEAFVGAGTVGVRGALLGTLSAGPLVAALDLGTRSGTGAEIGALEVSPAIVWGAGVALEVSDTLSGSLELDGERWLGNGGLAGATPLEWLGAAHLGLGRGRLTVGAGSGLTRGVGAPDFRVIGGFTIFAGDAAEPEPVAVVAPEAPVATEPEKGWLVVRAMSPGGDPIGGAEVRVVGTLGTPLQTGRDGILEARVAAGNHEVTLAAEGWLPEARTLSLDADETLDLTVVMKPAEEVLVDTEAKRIFLQRKVFFEVDRTELKVESLQVLDLLVEVLQAHPEITKLRIEGHTDVTGSDAHNLELSQGRAQSVVDYLVKSGIARDRLEAKGKGETEPLQQGDSEDVHATNRRVEFHILEIAPR